ncbi:kinase suppressor of Ras 2 isoform X2 [Nematostella vectensis]|uniref:kinase suppressor of Ras 2 isoform X2 n=1 Tax=Nematostella vectensis TaxID=45351 RepID=UPI00207785CB|nr:kinase suppressor of Ras 2 isoform X2 [Nematostella vectensis]
MQEPSHSFAKSILCRRSCDACRRVIRFWGVRCKDCNLKCHRKCYAASFSPCSTTRRPRRSTCQVRLWRRSHFGKDVKRPSDTGRGLAQMRENQNILPRKYTDAKGRIRQKLINGLYDSFCYSPRQALDLYPSVNTHATTKATVHRQQADSPLACSPARYTRDGDLMHDSPRRFTSPAHEQYLPCPHAWTRTYSCSSRTSNITSFTGSSGYSSMPASCPSSANSHRSCSPTPDFSNIRSLTATLERYNVEEELELVEDEEYTSTGDWRKAFSTYSLPATWPLTRKNTSIKENTRRIVSVDNCQTSSERREYMRLFPPFDENDEENIIKKSLKEWNIPYSDLQFGDKVGIGPKGHVYKGRWHGEIMIHTVKKSSKIDLEEFLKEVSLLSMIRHENVVLFMGACLEPPNLAFITSVRRGLSLHTHLHVRRDFFPLATRISIARQVAQGMSYLHAKGIILPRLNSMNVFLESKVKLCVTGYTGRKLIERHGYASLPRGHLTYVPPEHMRKISWSENELELVQCCNSSVKTNVYVFGTLLYEIMTGRWPFSHFPVESIIWMVGKGKKQCLRHVKCPEKTKNLIRECWSDNSEDRPDFAKIVQFFQEHNVGLVLFILILFIDGGISLASFCCMTGAYPGLAEGGAVIGIIWKKHSI